MTERKMHNRVIGWSVGLVFGAGVWTAIIWGIVALASR